MKKYKMKDLVSYIVKIILDGLIFDFIKFTFVYLITH